VIQSDPRNDSKEDRTMSIPRYPLRATAIVLGIAALVVGGCGSDNTSSPVNVDPLDEAPPLAPTGVSVTMQYGTKFALAWSDNTEPDLAGYRVYLYRPDPMRANAFELVSGENLLTRSGMTLTGEGGSTYLFRVAAVDLSGNESGWSEPFTFSLHTNAGQQEGRSGGVISEAPSSDPDTYGPIGHFPDSDLGGLPGRNK
jgi:hypothetical protein